MRFIYDRVTWSKVKLNDALLLPRRISLDQFILEPEVKSAARRKSSASYTYELKVVMYHKGKSTEVRQSCSELALCAPVPD